jgi:hypothetical protein
MAVRRGKRGVILVATLLVIAVLIAISSLTGLIPGYSERLKPPRLSAGPWSK